MDRRPEPPTAREILTMLWRDDAVPSRPGPGTVTYTALPRWDRATVLVPHPPRVAAAVLRVAGSSPTRRGHLRGQLAGGAARAGALRVTGARVRVAQGDPGSSMVSRMADELDADVLAGVHLGPPRANRKPVLQLVAPGGRTVGFGKVGIDPLTQDRVLAETRALGALGERLRGALRAPELLTAGRWAGHAYAVTAPVPLAGRVRSPSPARYEGALQDLVAAWPVHRQPLAEAPWWRDVRAAIAALTGPEATWLRTAAERVERLAGDRLLLLGASHGDWSPWNCAVLDHEVVAWDWERFDPHRPVGVDALHFSVQAVARLEGRGPLQAVAGIAERSGTLVAGNGAAADDGPLVAALYLLERGLRFVADGQAVAGARKGPVEAWLRPGLETLVEGLR